MDRDVPWMLYLMAATFLIVVVAGAIATLTGNYDEDFRQWVDDVAKLGIGIGVFGAGRAIKNGAIESKAQDEPASPEEDELLTPEEKKLYMKDGA